MFIYSNNGTAIGEVTHNVNKETIVHAFRRALEDALPNGYMSPGFSQLPNIVNIPQDCEEYQERLNFAIEHIHAVYSLAAAYGRAEDFANEMSKR